MNSRMSWMVEGELWVLVNQPPESIKELEKYISKLQSLNAERRRLEYREKKAAKAAQHQ